MTSETTRTYYEVTWTTTVAVEFEHTPDATEAERERLAVMQAEQESGIVWPEGWEPLVEVYPVEDIEEVRCPYCPGPPHKLSCPAFGAYVQTEHALAAVANERNRQRAKWGVQQHSPAEWMAILGEEFGEVCREAVDVEWEHPGFSWERLRQELVETAAVAVQIVEWLDSRPVSKELRDDA